MAKDNRPYRYKLIQDGAVVAAVECAEHWQAIREIKHYALMYSQDGPVTIEPPLPKYAASPSNQG